MDDSAATEATKVTATELVNRLPDILDRVKRRGERFVIVQDGEPVARIEPAGLETWSTLREIAERRKDVPLPGDGFADDLEEIRASQPRWEFPKKED